MLLTRKIIAVLYCLALAADIWAIMSGAGEGWRYAGKCLLMPLLIFLVFIASVNAVKKYIKFLLIIALLFSWTGDILLVDDDQMSFIAGLASFLLAHIAYILLFTRIVKNTSSNKRLLLISTGGMFIYTFLLVLFLWKRIEGLRLPVVAYALILSLMFITALQLKAVRRLSKKISSNIIAGASLFVVSDSILAIERFYFQQQLLQVIVMITYAAAQLFLARGIVRYINKI